MIPDDFREIVLSKTDKETGKLFSISEATVGRWKRKLKISKLAHRTNCLPKTLTSHQQSIVNGLLLGDGAINKCGRLAHGQAARRLSYTKFIASEMGVFSKPISSSQKVVGDKIFKSITLRTCCHDIFRCLREEWYVGCKKVVPKSLQLNPITLAYWFADDGCSHANSKEITLATNCFVLDDVLFLIKRLGLDLGIGASENRKGLNYVVRIKNKSYFDFLEMVQPYIQQFACFDYKLEGLIRDKEDIMVSYKDKVLPLLGMRHKEIAKIVGCSVNTVKRWSKLARQGVV